MPRAAAGRRLLEQLVSAAEPGGDSSVRQVVLAVDDQIRSGAPPAMGRIALTSEHRFRGHVPACPNLSHARDGL